MEYSATEMRDRPVNTSSVTYLTYRAIWSYKTDTPHNTFSSTGRENYHTEQYVLADKTS